MIHRQNWLDVRNYLSYLERIKQNDIETVKRARSHLRHLLEWADEKPFPKSRGIDPTFPTYLLTARADGREIPLASASVRKCLTNARQFFTYARKTWPNRYKVISESWVELLLPPRHMRAGSHLRQHKYWSLENVLKVVAVSAETLHEERAQVAVAMLYLSGMRADALASLPISCVDLTHYAIYQLPEQGVRTKNRKAAVTYLLHVEPLLAVIERWHARVQSLPPSSLWYATLSSDGMQLTVTERAFQGRNNTIERDVRMICQRAQVPYLSPHKLRHGHIVYARSLARTPDEIKAISQNVMHSSSIITDQVYSDLVADDIRNIITTLGKQARPAQTDLAEVIMEQILDKLKNMAVNHLGQDLGGMTGRPASRHDVG